MNTLTTLIIVLSIFGLYINMYGRSNLSDPELMSSSWMTKMFTKENNENENVNEQVDLDNFQAPFTSEDFVNYVNSEFDIEMLGMMQNVIQKRMNFLKRMVDMGRRKEIKGFRRFD